MFSHANLIAIVGPTASGKSALGVSLAERFGGEVVACDSTQVYRGFDIGTAKPALAERRGVPHHMLDLLDPAELFTAGEYRRRALDVLADLRIRNRLPVFTVGTGLYLRALLEGLADAPARSLELREQLGAIVSRRGGAHLLRILQRLDPSAAARISAGDLQKITRAIEVRVLTGRPLTEIHSAGREALAGYAPLKIGLNPPRAALYRRIEDRVGAMLNRGWCDEVAALIASAPSGAAPMPKPFEFIGYRELREHIEKGKPLPETIAAIAQATRRYAKRQLTWFRKEPAVHWFAGFGDDAKIVASVAVLVERHLAGLDPLPPPSSAFPPG